MTNTEKKFVVKKKHNSLRKTSSFDSNDATDKESFVVYGWNKNDGKFKVDLRNVVVNAYMYFAIVFVWVDVIVCIRLNGSNDWRFLNYTTAFDRWDRQRYWCVCESGMCV